MSRLSNLTTKKEYEINGELFEFESVELDDDMAELLEAKEDMPGDKMLSLLRKCIVKMVKQAVPDATDEEMKIVMRIDNFTKFIDAFYDVNGLKDVKGATNAERVKQLIEQKKDARRPKG